MTSSDQVFELHGAVRPRPIRVAYLIAVGEHADAILDAVFAECYSRWGGGYSLIIPCQNAEPSPQYVPWLHAYDPDIIYSYVELDDEIVRALHEKLCPSSLHLHDRLHNGKHSPHYYRPNHRLEALSSLSTALPYARAFPASAPKPMLIVDYLTRQTHDRFIDDNFGTHFGSFQRWPIPENLADAVQPLTVASEELLNNPRMGHKIEGEAVYDTPSLLSFMARKHNTFGVAQLASDATPRIDITDHSHNAFNLVIGDTVNDRLMFWNDRSRMPPYLGRAFTTLIVAPDRLGDEQFFNALVNFIKARNGVSNPHGSPWVILRSASQSRKQLSEYQARFNEADRWNSYHLDRVDHPRPAVPDERKLRETHWLVTGGPFNRQTVLKEFSAHKPTAQVPPTLPEHLHGIHTTQATMGGWAIDVDISREPVFGRSNWFLPRRLRMHGSFRAEGAARPSRANREGQLVLFVNDAGDAPKIVVPTDEQAFAYALQQGQDWWPFKNATRDWHPTGPYAWCRPSDKGHYLIFALRLFGGADPAARVLLHKYWTDIFESLGSTIGETRIEAIKAILKKKLRAGVLMNEDEWERLARVVASEARQVRMPLSSISFDELEKRHVPYVERERKLLEEQKTTDLEQWIADANATLARGVRRLCLNGILHQGYEWPCPACYHTNWSGVNALRPELACEVCGTNYTVPVDKPWDFRLNGFLLEGLKEHGLLPLVWALKRLALKARNSFYFLPPHELFNDLPKNEQARPDREVDLICVVDGHVHLVEAKSSHRSIDLEPTVDAAKRIRPDVVTLAPMKPATRAISDKLKKLRELLKGTGIEAQVITAEQSDLDDEAYLL